MVHIYDSLMFLHLLKVKVFHTDDAIVLAHKASKTGQFAGQLGALHCAKRDGAQFDVGTGLTHALRAAPPAIGTVIEYSYFEMTAAGVSRFPAYVRVRSDVDASEFPWFRARRRFYEVCP